MADTLIDTDVLIDFLRGRPYAKDFIAQLPARAFVSAITVAELYVGVKSGKERSILIEFLDTLEILPLDGETAAEGGLLRRRYGPSHGVGLNDALIAATAIRHKLELATLNRKHYPMVKALRVPYEKG